MLAERKSSTGDMETRLQTIFDANIDKDNIVNLSLV